MTKEVQFAGGTLPIGSFKMRKSSADYLFHMLMKNSILIQPLGISRRLFVNRPLKKKRADSSAETGCTNCKSDSVCKDDCECRGLSMSCSKSCHCSDLCSNKPFRKDKKIKIVKSEGCGWGAVALEPLEKGDFIIEYVGEVINDATCEQRLWDMKRRGDKNFYMCEISKDFTIDATFKGNTSRFLNHSCDPNCKLEKWQVEGETRVGVFASRFIEVGEPLTYDYREYTGSSILGFLFANLCALLGANEMRFFPPLHPYFPRLVISLNNYSLLLSSRTFTVL
uniref:Histone-lysine N-methyltransferase ASHR3 n=1 Tax=Aegilops tauschii TaxID=37682 RepID=M8BY05_AEGTA